MFEGPLTKLTANGNDSLTARYLRGDLKVAAPRERRQRGSQAHDAVLGRAPAQPEEHRGGDPARHDGGDHGRFGVGQVDAGARRDLPLAGSRCTKRARPTRAKRPSTRQPKRSKRAADGVQEGGRRRPHHYDGDDRSIAHRAHAALESGDVHQGVRHHPRAVRLHARGGKARLYGGALLVQHPGRPLRDLPGRRHGDGGDAVPGRCGTDLRRVQGHALQERHSGDPVQRPERPRSAAADGARGDDVFPRHAANWCRS